ncbi:hypothetical protein Hdeb2414_s0012g00385281 [Helianthus debilis subsp. tardiflorus]
MFLFMSFTLTYSYVWHNLKLCLLSVNPTNYLLFSTCLDDHGRLMVDENILVRVFTNIFAIGVVTDVHVHLLDRE